MATSPISDVTQKQSDYTGSSTKSTNNADTSTEFMTLMLAQLKNQNPMDPVDDKQLLTQMATLNSLTQLQNISKKLDAMTNASQMSYASSLIGKTVVASDGNNKEVTGVVSSMQYAGGSYYIDVNGTSVKLSTVTKVSSTETTTEA
jgi:flagellar basal-body rod modification protein FlgD